MSLINAAMMAMIMLQGASAPAQNLSGRALTNYQQMLAGQRQLHDLTPDERAQVQELERWLHGRGGIKAGETKAQCKERLQSDAPSTLESALLDLKCSQRPGP